MPSWKKVITSGSDAVLNSVIATGSLDTITRELIYNNQTVLDWDLHQLAANGVTSVEWDDRKLFDSSAVDSIDWSTRQLFNHQGNASIDYDYSQLIDTQGTLSVEWSGRQLINSSSNVVLDWYRNNITASANIYMSASTQLYGTASYALTASRSDTSTTSVSSSITFHPVNTTYGLVFTNNSPGNRPLHISPYGPQYDAVANSISNISSVSASSGFFGTASYARQSLSASYALTASYVAGVSTPTLQQVTTQGNTTTNNVIISASLIVSNSIDSNIRNLYDTATTRSIDWTARQLFDASGTPVLYWSGSNQLILSASNLYIQRITTGSTNNVLTYNPTTGQVYYTASSAIGGGSSGPETDPIFTAWSGSTTSQFAGTSSFALTASLAPNYVLNTATSSFVLNSQTSSMTVLSSSFALTASYVRTALTSSFVTASNVNGPYGSNSIQSASYAVTASYISNINAAGNDTEIQFNSNGILYATSSLTYLYASQSINHGNNKVTGIYSRVSGLRVTASSDYSQAEGFNTWVYGNYSHAEGSGSRTSAEAAHAEGVNTLAKKVGSHAEGLGTLANAPYQLTIGRYNSDIEANGDGAFIIGDGTSAVTRNNFFEVVPDLNYMSSSGDFYNKEDVYFPGLPATGSLPFVGIRPSDGRLYRIGKIVLGTNGVAIGSDAISGGKDTQAIGDQGFSIGDATIANGTNAVSTGKDTNAVGSGSLTTGDTTTAVGDNSVATGKDTIAVGTSSLATGKGTVASGSNAVATGRDTIASGSNSMTAGSGSKADAENSVAFGKGTIAKTDEQVVIGRYNTADTQSLFVIGSGTSEADRKTIMKVDTTGARIDGSVTISGSSTFTNIGPAVFSGSIVQASTIATGIRSVALGNNSEASGDYAVAYGFQTTALGNYSFAGGANTIASGTYSVALGANTYAAQNASLAFGGYSRTNGLYSIAAGLRVTSSGLYQVVVGKDNIELSNTAAFIVGNGTNNDIRSNLLVASGDVVQVTGSLNVNGNVIANSFTGSLLGNVIGTSSWAENALTASYVSSNFQYEVHVSQVDGNDTTGNGDLLKPVATIGKALLIVSASVASTDRRTIIVHPGTYFENITVNTTNTYFFSTGLLGANCLISGSVTVSAATRMSGLKMTNLIVSSSAPVYINNCAVDKQMTVSGSGYLEVQNTSLQCTSGIQVVGPASSGVIFENCSLYPLTVNNASAAVYIISCNQAITPTLTAGALTITRSTISSLTSGATSTALTTAAGSVLVLESCNVYNSLLTSHAAITANGFYSIKNIIYNRSASTLASLSGTGGPLATISQFQYINADNITTSGLTVTGSLNITGSTTQIGNINLTGSLTVTQGITGSLFGTSSWASNAITSSFANTASFVNTLRQNVIVTGSVTATTFTGSLRGHVVTSSINTSQSVLINSFGTAVDWANSSLGYSSVASVNWASRTLTDSGNVITANWQTKALTDSNGTSIDWGNRVLKDSANGYISVDYGNRALYNDGNGATLNYSTSNKVTTKGPVTTHLYDAFLTETEKSQSANFYAGELYQTDSYPNVGNYGELVYLDYSTNEWVRINQTTNVCARYIGIDITDKIGVLTEGHIVMTDAANPFSGGIPQIENPLIGMPVYIIEGSNGSLDNSYTCNIPASGYVRVIGHVMYKGVDPIYGTDKYMIKFKPSNDWYEI